MPAKVMILALFDHGYYIRGTLKRLTGALPGLTAWWICGTLKRLTDVAVWLKAWWLCVSVKQVTEQKSMAPLHRWRGNACKSHDFGSVWPWILYPWDFEEADRSCGLAQGLVHLSREEMPPKVVILAQFGDRYYIRETLKNRCHCYLAGEEMPAKVMIVAQFDHGYYILGTLKRLTDVVAWLKALWIHFGHGYYIRGTLKWLMGALVWLKASWICEMPAKVMIVAQFGHGYYIHGMLKPLMGALVWLKASWMCTRNPCPHCIAGEEMPAKVVILAQLDHGYYICETLKRLTNVVGQLKAWWIRARNPCPHCLGGEEMPPKVMILAQFEHGYYIHRTLKRLMVVLAWLKDWCICVGVKQVTDLKSMPPLPRWRGNARKSRDFGSVWPWILYPWDFEEADRCCGLAPGLVDLLTNSKAVFCAFSLKISEEKS
ncbi:hypothetical protein C8R44DRAFT_742248 [Mycena epipterygia]|nr:hypothetical protein C8R44DRAFT_742248 [Mycena epipterygia]